MGTVPFRREPSYLGAERGLWSWLTTTDHKRIGILYLVLVAFFFLFAVGLGFTMRLHLVDPAQKLLSNDAYNRVLTLHGIAMIFLFIIPAIPSIFGNFFLPILIGARDVAFPKLNLMSWYLYAAGGLLALVSVALGGPDTGWTFYVPYSFQTGANVTWPLLGAFLVGWSSILTGINFVATVHRLRHPKMRWSQLPLFVWATYATAWIQVIVTPVVGILLVLVLAERFLGVGIFDPTKGGDPVLYQHVFWIYSHPAVYIMVLPAMGVVSEIIPTFARRTIFGYKFIAASSLGIASIGSLVWGHHMFTSGMADEARIIFSFLTFLVAVPSAIKVFNWLATLYGGSIEFSPPLLLSLQFVALFSIGGLTGLMLASLSTDVHLHDTSFVVGHFHYTMFGGAGSAFLAACHYWFPKMFGRMYNERVAYLGIALFFVGFNLTYMPLMLAGVAGMPRRYADYLPEYAAFHQLSSAGAWFLVGGLLVMFGNLALSIFRGRVAAADPYGGKTLEWTTASPPPPENFHGEVELKHGPYDYPVEVEEPERQAAQSGAQR
jgi:cytochrome c oxidase subunit 1